MEIRLAATAFTRAFLIAGMATSVPAGAADWQPSQPLRIIVHTAPGSGADLFARHISEIVRRDRVLPVPVEVVNRSGGGGAVAINALLERKGDPSHILCVTNVFLTTPLSQKSLPTYRDFQPVAVMAHDTNAVHVNASSPYRSVKDLIDAAGKSPKSVTHASGAFGGTDHIIGFQLARATGVQFNYVAFKGGSEATVALLGKHVDFITGNPGETRAQVESGQLRMLAIVGDKRLPTFPNVPTLRELGVNITGTYAVFRGFVAPPAIPAGAVDTYAAALRKTMDTAEWKQYVRENELVEEFLGPVGMAKFLQQRNEDLSRALAEISAPARK